LMVTMIVGGTFIPLLMGLVADASTITFSFTVPLLCICYILFLGIINNHKKSKSYGQS